jgi:hypothetical protein
MEAGRIMVGGRVEGYELDSMYPSVPKGIGLAALGLDTLYLTVRGERVREEFAEGLRKAKLAAEIRHEPVTLDGCGLLGEWAERPLYVMPKATRGFKYLAYNEMGVLQVNPVGQAQSGRGAGWPLVRARLSSEYLHMRPAGAVEDATAYLELVPEQMADAGVQVGEAHYHVDVTGWEPQYASRWVCPSGEFTERAYYDERHARRVQSMLFGKVGETLLQVAIYHKEREMARFGHDDPVLRAIWERNGRDEGSTVYRVEARFQREFLRSRGVTTANELHALRGGLWAYATQDWLSERVVDDTRTDRMSLTAGWEYIARQVFPDQEPAPLVPLDRTADAVQLMKQFLGVGQAIAARQRIAGLPFADTFDLLMADPEVGRVLRDGLHKFAAGSAAKARELGVPIVGDEADRERAA